MKKFVSLVILAASLAASARAAVIIGGDVGYLVDAEEAYYSARLGFPVATKNTLSHQVELEVGYTEQKDSGAKGDFVPLTLNYRLESTPANKLGFYFGVGAGIAFTDVSGFGASDNGNSFAAQAFTGLTYHASQTVSLHAGVKYIWIDNVKLFGTKIEVGDDVALSAGISFKF